jgi:uncharacterized protein YjbI with pentapeptide repeats
MFQHRKGLQAGPLKFLLRHPIRKADSRGGLMDSTKPTPPGLRISNDPMYQLLREGCIKEFNVKRAAGERVDLTDCDLRGLDLRGLEVEGLDFSGSYFRQADLRGIDFRNARLEGASINAAKISGAYFPAALHPSEIELSLLHGTRMRYRHQV